MPKDFEKWFSDDLSVEQQEAVKANLLGPREPAEPPTPMERVRRALDEGPTPDETRRDRRGK